MEEHDNRCELKFAGKLCKCERRKRNSNDFIRLWTAAGAAENYNKKSWLDVERQLFSIGEI